jgi:uncharacterized membrane protein
MLPVPPGALGQSAAYPPTTMRQDLTDAPSRQLSGPVPPSPPPARFYSYGYLVVTLAVMAVYAAVSFVRPHSILEIPLGLFALLFAPGYALAAPLFARQPGLPWTVNLPITVGLSVVVNVLVGIALLRVGPGLSTRDSAIADLAIVLVGLIMFVAREAADTEVGSASSMFQDITNPVRDLRQRLRFVGFSGGQRAAAVTLLVLITLVFGFIVYVAVAEPHPGLAVSFGMVGPDGTVASIPSNATNSSTLSVGLTVSNSATAQGFQILVVAETSPRHPSPTNVSWSLPLPFGRATQSVLAFPLGAGKNTTVPVSFTLVNVGNYVGNYTVTFTLESASGAPLKSLVLPLNII